MSITNIISAIGNNRSIYPLMFRDCVIEVPSKIYITRKANLKESREKANDATREKFIDEYITSAVWLGGIPVVEKISNKLIAKKGYNADISMKLLKEEAYQGIEYNIKKFKKIAPDAVKDLENIKVNKKQYEKYVAGKYAAAIIIPTLLMGFILPKFNFALTKKIKQERKRQQSKNIAFGNSFVSVMANLNTVDKMAITDGGLTVGRVATSRNREEGYSNAFRMAGSMFLNFVAPKYIARFLDKTANKLFKINVDLDPLIMEDKDFKLALKNKTLELPKSNSAKDIIEFLDNKPKSIFSKIAQKGGMVHYLQNGVRDPRKYLNIENLVKLKQEVSSFAKNANMSGNVEKFAKKAKFVKSANIIANVVVSSLLLAFALPKAQYKFIKYMTGSYSDPGLTD